MRTRPRSATLLTCTSVLVLVAACTSGSDGGDTGPVVGAPIIELFEVEPGGGLGVGCGEVTLSWKVADADTVSIDQGIGVVDGDGVEVAATVTKSTMFTLTATNSKGSSEASTVALVASSGPPAIDRNAPSAAEQTKRSDRG